jgi:undecaprenyl-phosphate 4-deoxy-4-formamido-L-arabinose transferase
MDLPHEIILVNDGSSDGSWQTITAVAQEHKCIKGLSLTRNYGQQSALLCGIREAVFDVTVCMDDDLQHPPEELPQLVDALKDRNLDVVFGTPETMPHPFWRVVAARSVKALLSLVLGDDNIRNMSAFLCFRTELRTGFDRHLGPTATIEVLLSWVTSRSGAVNVKHQPRKRGKTGYTLQKLVDYTLMLITSYSTALLRLATLIGILLTASGCIAAVLRIFVPGGNGWLITLLAGIQLFFLGIASEYLARLYFRTMGRPPYVIRETTSQDIEIM